MSSLIQNILNYEPVSRVRRNHGLEHATLHVLARQYPRTSMAGYSNTGGYWIIGDVSTEAVANAAAEALLRMNQGERNLAVHPNCGTNFVTSGALAGVAGAAAMFGSGPRWKDRFERLSLAALFATVALILAQPLGNLLQARFTTSGEPRGMQIVRIESNARRGVPVHRVITRG